MSGIMNSVDVSASGLTLQRKKMDVVAQNIANAETTRSKEGGPYRRRRVVASEIKEQTPFRTVMMQADSKLRLTHANHLPGSFRLPDEEIPATKARGEEIEDPTSTYRLVYDPQHPDADDKGFVKMPDIEIVTEMVDMMAASRAYEANTMAVLSAKEMAKNALEI
jgi:flagellar basal-body rod protein FlgC